MYVVPVVIISILLNAPKLFETVIVYEPVNTVDRYVLYPDIRPFLISGRIPDIETIRIPDIRLIYNA